MKYLFSNPLKYASSQIEISALRKFSYFSHPQLGQKKHKVNFFINKEILNLTKENRGLYQLHKQETGLQYPLGLLKISIRLFGSGLVLKNKINRANSFDKKKAIPISESKTIASDINKLKEADIPLNSRLTYKESNELLLSKFPAKTFGRKILKLNEKDWKEMWSRKFNKLLNLGDISPDSSDKLLFAYLNEKKQHLKLKYTFNEFFSSSQLITYNFNNSIKKIDLNYLYKILKSFFKKLESLISLPYLEISPDKVKIRLFYYVLPSITKKLIHQRLHRYIRSDEKLYKELILRRKFQSIMEKFKMKLFIAKWKEDNYLTGTPSPISLFKGLNFNSINHVKIFKDSPSTSIKNTSFRSEDSFQSQSHIRLTSPYESKASASASEAREIKKIFEYKTLLDLLKLNLFKLTEQHDLLKACFGEITVNNRPDISLSQSEANLYLTSLHKSLIFDIKDVNDADFTFSRGSHESKPANSNVLKEADLAKEYLALIRLSKEGATDSRLAISDQLGVLSSAVGLVTNTPSTILKDKTLKVLETDIVKSDTRQASEDIEIIKSQAQDRISKLKEKTVPTMVSLNKVKFKYLIYVLENLFKKTIILELVRLKYPYHESNILAQVLGLSSKSKNFRKIMIKLLYTATVSNPTNKVIKKNFSIIPSYLSGLKVRLAGRLITQRVVPRFTVQSFQIGSLARGKVNFTNSSRVTLKNKRGAFSFTVTTSHIFDK
jgi:Mitochondrial ribosomal protein (VAR1)